jgi:hypothetical protein
MHAWPASELRVCGIRKSTYYRYSARGRVTVSPDELLVPVAMALATTVLTLVVGPILLQAAVPVIDASSIRENQCQVALQPPGQCLRGQAFAHLTSIRTPAACCAACAARLPQCAAFEVRAWGRGGTEWTCILLNTTGNTIEDNCSASGSFASRPTPPPSPPQPQPPPSPPPTLAFASMFSGGAVLQKEARVAVWGTSSGSAGSAVQLLLAGTYVASATVDINGIWLAHLPPQRVNWGIRLTAHDAQGVASVTVKFGQVLMCSGQVSSACYPARCE